MKKHLYDTFADRWYREGGTIYIYSDPHFGDLDCYKLRFPEIFKKCKFKSKKAIQKFEEEMVEELDTMQIKNINAVCGKNDTLIILGDVGNVDVLDKLRAKYKVLIMGNHDKGQTFYIHHFNEVYEGSLQISPKIILSHEPVHYLFALNIHGHVHERNPLGAYRENMVVKNGEVTKYFEYNCCAEQIDYKPVNLGVLIKTGMFKNVPDIHRVTIDRATERSKNENSKN